MNDLLVSYDAGRGACLDRMPGRSGGKGRRILIWKRPCQNRRADGRRLTLRLRGRELALDQQRARGRAVMLFKGVAHEVGRYCKEAKEDERRREKADHGCRSLESLARSTRIHCGVLIANRPLFRNPIQDFVR